MKTGLLTVIGTLSTLLASPANAQVSISCAAACDDVAFFPAQVIQLEVQAPDCSKIKFLLSDDGSVSHAASERKAACTFSTYWTLPSRAESRDPFVIVYDDTSKDSLGVSFARLSRDGLILRKPAQYGYVDEDVANPVEAVADFTGRVSDCSAALVKFLTEGADFNGSSAVRGQKSLDRQHPNRCEFSTRWKLGDYPGDQTMAAQLTGFSGDSTSASVDVVAHERARFFIAVAGIVDGRRITNPDSLQNGIAETEPDRFAPIFGVDIPMAAVWWRLRDIRLVVGTEMTDPAKNIYVGVDLTTLLFGVKREKAPIRFAAGFRSAGEVDTSERAWASIVLDVSSITSFIKAIG